ncbi:MAG: NAD(+) synthase [Candidatus Omnitrophica bacterium]|nr:NAD(+) synthase [Candidatus Omnitrophota bacterium]MDD5352151.1 NAD(+) synthase [Candidatus Omnitrophota bacterium]MDD5549749.1 NAD(+) synthase [Candidatus Omnitrophota bacterium]
MSLAKEIAGWIKKKVKQAKAEGVVIGLSGGIDSSCVAVLSKMALGSNVLGLILPCQSDSQDERLARLLADKFDIKVEKKTLDPVYEKLKETLPKAGKLAMVNLKPRLRMLTLYYFANKMNYLVAGCGNKSEITVGYFTKYGDGGADIFPLGGLLKTEVRKLAKELGIPREIIERAPTAGLWQGQTDESEMGITYEDLDKAIIAIEKGKARSLFSQEIVAKVKNLIRVSDHKRLPIPIYEKGRS